MPGSIAPQPRAKCQHERECGRGVVGRERDGKAVRECELLEREAHRIRGTAVPPDSGQGRSNRSADCRHYKSVPRGLRRLRDSRRHDTLQRAQRVFYRLKPRGRVFLQALHDGRLDVFGQRRRELSGIRGALPNLFQRYRDRRVPVERRFSGEHFVENQAERVDVGAMVERLALGLFGGHIRRRPDHAAGDRGILRVGARDAEVHHLQLAIGTDHDVLGFEVEMHDGLPVRLGEAVGKLARELDGASDFETPLALQETAETLSLHEFHGEVDCVAGTMELVQTGHVAMGDLVRQQQLVLEALQDLWIGGDLRLQDLDCQDFTGLAVADLTDNAHATAAQLAEHLIPRGQGRRRERGHESGLVFRHRHDEVYTSARRFAIARTILYSER